MTDKQKLPAEAFGSTDGLGRAVPKRNDFPRFGDAYFAFFNQSDADRLAGRSAVRKAYGDAGVQRVLRLMRSGAMEIFQHPQTPEATLYVQTVALEREKRSNVQFTGCPQGSPSATAG